MSRTKSTFTIAPYNRFGYYVLDTVSERKPETIVSDPDISGDKSLGSTS